MSKHQVFTVKPVFIAIGFMTSLPAIAEIPLISFRTQQAIELDGVAEDAWIKAAPLRLVLDKTPYKPNQYDGIFKTNYSIRSLYDDDYVYFFVQWEDPTKSVERFPWEKQQDNTWKRLMNKDQTGHENTYYEDKTSIFWNIKAEGFGIQGCDIACHMVDAEGKVADIENQYPGRKFTRIAEETIDMWHWKAVRTGLTDQFDDQYVDSNIDPIANKNWGRKNDQQTGGGYRDNITDDKLGPAKGTKLWNDIDSYALRVEDQVAFLDIFKPGNRLSSVLVEPFTGSRGDISAKAIWDSGMWTIEFKRKRVTTGENAKIEDIQFDDLSKEYLFGVAVFDNSQINHLYTEQVQTMVFEQPRESELETESKESSEKTENPVRTD
ncbi:ethylbenzene dehydrogenase-related protein [uncultured Photobacterium sp.]|uniref:ethylbenzene dehydrogenase-related protein n=1 Tax=uncultured Photobacterium sp. TaxID=173973 RepID=UPI00260883F8|nr:ethylbenzene dehydrogenase-related protein [uncultured Photobacterium sp.]